MIKKYQKQYERELNRKATRKRKQTGDFDEEVPSGSEGETPSGSESGEPASGGEAALRESVSVDEDNDTL